MASITQTWMGSDFTSAPFLRHCGNIFGSAGEARRMVYHGKVIVHRLRDTYHINPFPFTSLAHLAAGIHRTVAAVKQHILNIIFL
jgi:hypothetical protein